MKSLYSNIQTHQKRVLEYLKHKRLQHFSIVRTCKVQNNEVLEIDNVSLPAAKDIPCVAFTPAAGAATRYNQVYDVLVSHLSANDSIACEKELTRLAESLEGCPIPVSLKSVVGKKLSSSEMAQIFDELSLPKALYPAVMDGETFLELKNQEHNNVFKVDGQVFIVTMESLSHFKSIESKLTGRTPVYFLDQNKSLCTYRFTETGDVIKDAKGEPIWVAGGHGLLVRLLPDVKKLFAKARSVLIRNIDNIQGDNEASKSATDKFFQFYSYALGQVDQIRDQLHKGNVQGADASASIFLQILGFDSVPGSDEQQNLKDLQYKVFHSPSNQTNMSELFQRPLNVLGMVPNTGNDVGGTACIVDIDGEKIKICLEVPHASDEDKLKHLNSARDSFFNPVFILAELSNNLDTAYQAHPFWTIAQKTFKGQKVYYHEELLSEVLGNSVSANCLFVSLPRSTFNPHKTVFDSKGRNFNHWFKSLGFNI